MAEPRVSIIIRAWGEQGLTYACLESLVENTTDIEEQAEIILVDQAGLRDWEDGLTGKRDEMHSWCDFLVITRENLGAVTATNLGLQIAMTRPSDLILILDNDTRIPDGDTGWLERWVHHFDDEKVGAAGATTDYVAAVQHIAKVPRSHTKAIEQDGRQKTWTGPYTVPWLISFACMYRKAALKSMPAPRFGTDELSQPGVILPDGTLNQEKDDWQEAHLWDERFNPGNWEDIDVSIRLATRGWKLVVARDVYIHHRGSVTFKKGDFGGLLRVNKEKGVAKWGEAVLERLRIARRVG